MCECIVGVVEAMVPPTKPNGVKDDRNEHGVLKGRHNIPVVRNGGSLW
jgi:hypothetical protein